MDVPDKVREALAERYTIERELGRSGMGVVYLAHDLRYDRPVALKILLPELTARSAPERFQREIHFAARLQHPHILTVLDSGSTGELWYIMPFVEGESLRERLRRERRLPLEDALRITTEAARALDYAHQQGVIHRDVKPENILLTRDGTTLVADFGIARATGVDEGITRSGSPIGTPAYMSPEQIDEEEIDARSDLYAPSATLYEMLAGEPPFAGHVLLGLTLAYLGRRADALREGRRGMELMPISRDGYFGPYIQLQMVRIYLLLGEREKALDQLEPLLRVPFYISPSWLRIDPTFDPLRNDPRFRQLLEGAA